MKRYSIYTQVEGHEPKYLESYTSEEKALARVRTYERKDRYEVEVEGYGFPYGLPKYTIAEE